MNNVAGTEQQAQDSWDRAAGAGTGKLGQDTFGVESEMTVGIVHIGNEREDRTTRARTSQRGQDS